MADEYEIGSEPVEGTYKLGAPLDRDPRTDAPAPLPQAVRDRQARGQAFIDSVKANVKEHFSEPLGMSDERAQQWREHGILSDPATGRPGLLPPEDEAAFRLLTKAGDAALRGIGVALGVAGQAAGVVAGEFGAPDSERLGREISGELERRTILGEPLLRLAHTPDGPTKQPIGTAPADADFKIAAENIGGPHTEAKLRDLWDQRGIHPAEAAHDAGNDSFLKSQLTSPEQSITDRSGIPHPIGSPVPEGTPRAELAKTGDQLIDRLLDVPDLQKAINDPVPTLYPNKDFPKTMTVDGVTFDTADPAAVHANIQQYAVDALKAGGMDPATALKVGFWDFAEKAEDAFYKAHGIDPASVAKDSAIDKPTAAESARARQIMQDHLDEEEGITQPITRFKRSVANDRFGEEGSIVTHEISPMATTSQGMFGATFSPSSAGKFVARIVGDNGNTGILASNKKVFLENPEKPALFDTREEAEQAARQALGAQEVEQPLRAVGAEVTGKLPDLTQQPPLPPGRLADAGRKAVDQITGLAQNIQYLLDPMATGSKAAMVIAKDAINSVRRIRWEHAQRDANLVRNFDREKLERMWNAADEESVAAQLGESREHQGLVTLTAEERAAVEQLQADSQAAWLHAIDSGMVEGEGLPAYTPRMVLNVAAASEHAGPQALNELGRNVFTRVSQMKHRKYMMAEETEAAAKELVARRLAERGASPAEIAEATAKVAIARNIRALPLATAKLKEAAIWHDMIR
jgi:hypothetical protein